jgi:carbonic anhydrase
LGLIVVPHELIEGLRRFRRDSFPRFREHYERLVADGQRPSTLFVGCSDSRVVPALLTDSAPGELFVVRNIGNLIPPFEPDAGYHGTSAAIEFAALVLGVRDIVVCGHSHCGAIAALYTLPDPATPHISRWLDLARAAALPGAPGEEVLRRTEKRSIVLQLERLMGYPMVRERVERGDLCLHGWYYVIDQGSVEILDLASGAFAPLPGEPGP